MKTLAEIALSGLSLLERLKPNPLDASIEVVVRLMDLSTALEENGKKELANQVTVLLLAVAPVDDHATRPEKLDVFASYLVQTLEGELKRLLE